MLAFGVLGFLMEENGFPVAPAILGIVLGPMLEGNFFNSMIKADGNFIAFFQRPIAGLLGLVTIAHLDRDDLVLLARRAGARAGRAITAMTGAVRPQGRPVRPRASCAFR